MSSWGADTHGPGARLRQYMERMNLTVLVLTNEGTTGFNVRRVRQTIDRASLPPSGSLYITTDGIRHPRSHPHTCATD